MRHPVLIVGAGPVGLMLAAELARFGVVPRIVDRATARTDKSKALVVWSRTLEQLDYAGCGPAFDAVGNRVTSANIVAHSRLIANISFETVASPHPYALMIPQSETERLLEEHLNAFDVAVERGVELDTFNASDDGVTATLRLADGTTEVVTADWMVGCDGAHSTVRHGLDVPFVGDTLPSDWLLADVHLTGLKSTAQELDLYWHPDGMLALFPISQNRYRVVADKGAVSADGSGSDPTMAEVQAILDDRGPGGIAATDPVWLSAFRINERKVADYRAGRVFLAGDAAHVHSPAGGQGMNTGMQDAANLAWKLALVCRGTCRAEPLLASYSAERSPIAEHVLAATGHLTTVAVLKGSTLQAVRNTAASLLLGLSPVRQMMADELTEVSIGYHAGPMVRSTQGHPGPSAGTRAPDQSGSSRDRPRFTVHAANAPAPLFARYADLLDPSLRPPFAEGGVWLVRPDGYIGVAAGRDGWFDIDDYLASIAC